MTTNYVLDLNAGLTQVLSDGTSQYLYGLGRVGEYVGGQWAYYATDALGSVRQIVDANGQVVFYQSYEPYGKVLVSSGTAESNYGYAGEWTDAYIKLIYLRSRYYAPTTGRFLTKDVWQGDYTRPLSLNRWTYVEGNPVNYTDPSGNAPYARMAAASYALQWYNSVNPEYGGMGDADCTNFVSQALKAGGFPEDDTWFFDSAGFELPFIGEQGCTQYHPVFGPLYPLSPYIFASDFGKPFCGRAWGLTEDLFDYFTITMGFQVVAEIEGTEPPTGPATGRVIPGNGEYIEFPVTVSMGDVVFYTQNHSSHLMEDSNNRFNHAAIIVGWGPPSNVSGKNNNYLDTTPGLYMPYIVDHSAGDMSFYGRRAINDTGSGVNKITIVHIPDEIPIMDSQSYDWTEYVKCP